MVPAPAGVILAAVLRFGARLIDSQWALVQEQAVHSLNSFLSLLGICHLHEGETAPLAGVSVFDNRDRLNRPISTEYCPELPFGYGRLQVADKDISHWLDLFHEANERRRSSAALRKLSLKWANVFRLPPLRAFGDFEFH